jgi:hypothetical protein
MATPICDLAATGGEIGYILRRSALIGYCDQQDALNGPRIGIWGIRIALDADAGREVWRGSPGGNTRPAPVSFKVGERRAVLVKGWRAQFGFGGLDIRWSSTHVNRSSAKNPKSAAPASRDRDERIPFTVSAEGECFIEPSIIYIRLEI